MPEQIDPNGRSLDTFIDRCGCFGCAKKNDGFGTWPSKEAIYDCGKRKREMKEAHSTGTPYESFNCEYKTRKTTTPELVLI
ncbi:MAG: hypothetical protein GTN36_01125 [Candidatus Aenigmarchaeota archaeon]|nr:hypothetical protein [Candidatus Aenigmarchaeota archaeon]